MITRLHEKPADPPRTRPPGTELVIGVIITFLLVQSIAAAPVAPLVVAASDSSPAAKAQANYTCDGLDDQVEIQEALAALPDGGRVTLTEGTFNCSGSIVPAAGTTVKGQGPEKTSLEFSRNGMLNISEERVTLDGFRIAGSGYVNASTNTTLDLSQWLGVLTVYASHAKIHNVTGTADASIQAVFLLLHNPNVYAPVLEDVEFVNCRAVDTGTYGFLHNAWGSTNMVIKDVRYDNCAAINCGKFGVFNPWITGFDFAELNDMDGLRVTNCLAEGNLESGFHFEFDPTVTNAVLENCVSRNNGQKAFPTKAYNPNDMSTHYFGCGYYAPNCDVTFINCVAEGNSMNGFYTTNGGKLYNCVEKDTGIGRSDFSYRVPAGYYSIPTRSVNPSTVLENCTSINSNGYGLQVDLANNVKIRNFHLVDPIGYKGKGSSLGGTNGQFDNSEVSIYASGNRVETLVWAKENVNTTFSGKIVSDAAKPFVIEGYRTKNVLVKDMEIVSKTLPAGSPGVTIVSTVPAGQATLQNVKVTSTGSPVPTPTVPGTAPTPTPTSTVTPGPSGKPDLVVTDISWTPANPATGNAVTLKATIKNQGDAPTPAGVKHGVLFTFDDGAAGSGVWSDAHTTAIAPGASVTVTANGGSAGATWKAVEGTHTVKANVDDVNRIAESNENNNVMSKEIVVGSLPVPVRGDLNEDGNVNWADVAIAAEMAQGTAPSDAAADLNGDGTVNWKDVALLADFFFGRTSSL